eukprot:5407956-Amphidinium_carterae.1
MECFWHRGDRSSDSLAKNASRTSTVSLACACVMVAQVLLLERVVVIWKSVHAGLLWTLSQDPASSPSCGS